MADEIPKVYDLDKLLTIPSETEILNKFRELPKIS